MSAARSPAALVAELLPLIEAMQRIDSRIYVDRGAELNRQAELATLLLARIRVLEGQAAAAPPPKPEGGCSMSRRAASAPASLGLLGLLALAVGGLIRRRRPV